MHSANFFTYKSALEELFRHFLNQVSYNWKNANFPLKTKFLENQFSSQFYSTASFLKFRSWLWHLTPTVLGKKDIFQKISNFWKILKKFIAFFQRNFIIFMQNVLVEYFFNFPVKLQLLTPNVSKKGKFFSKNPQFLKNIKKNNLQFSTQFYYFDTKWVFSFFGYLRLVTPNISAKAHVFQKIFRFL